VRWEADIVAPFWRRATQASALSAGHQEYPDLAARSSFETRRTPFCYLLWVLRGGVARVLRQGLYSLAGALFCRDGFLVDTVDALDVEGF
jgi:hypothetical protein